MQALGALIPKLKGLPITPDISNKLLVEKKQLAPFLCVSLTSSLLSPGRETAEACVNSLC